MSRDPRLTPARADLAAAHLKGEVSAERYVSGVVKQVITPVAPLHERPDAAARLETQALLGECVTVFDERDGWAWVQNRGDCYVGYMPADALGDTIVAPSHRVATLRTIEFAAPDVKSPLRRFLSLNAKVTLSDHEGAFMRTSAGAWLPAAHLAPINAAAPDFVAVAEQFLGTPYFWGGKDSFGLDCSGLVQASLEAAGLAAPRDADQQEAALGEPAPCAVHEARRGDLIFWDGHVAIVCAKGEILHANAFHMKVAVEPLAAALKRIASVAGAPTSLRRMPGPRSGKVDTGFPSESGSSI